MDLKAITAQKQQIKDFQSDYLSYLDLDAKDEESKG
jgi:hypothetical protein